jgi:hypothetical protein
VFIAENAKGLEAYYWVNIAAFIADGTTGAPTMLYQKSTTGGVGLGRAGCSHDGKYIVHTRVSGGHADVWVMFANGFGPRQVTFTNAVNNPNNASNGVFSAGNTDVAADTTIFYDLCDLNGNCKTYQIDADNTTEANLGTLISDGGTPAPSPNGLSLTVQAGDNITVEDLAGKTEATLPPISGGIGGFSWQ